MDRMMASAVVMDCVRKVGRHADTSEDKTLGEVGVGTEDRVDALIDVITTDRNSGVPSKNCRIDPNAFHDVDCDSAVGDVSDIVAAKATPVESES